MNFRFCLIVILVFLLTACANLSKNENESASLEEIFFDDGYKTSAEDEIIIDDKDFGGKEELEQILRESFQEIVQIASDNSKITTMFDRYGNKTQTRAFNNHPLLSQILLITSADGRKQIFVYGQNGQVKSLPENLLDKVLTATASEIANTAGIYGISGERRSTNLTINRPSDTQPLQPVPSSQFPIQTPRAEETRQNKAEIISGNQPNSQKDSTSPAVINPQPEDEQ